MHLPVSEPLAAGSAGAGSGGKLPRWFPLIWGNSHSSWGIGEPAEGGLGGAPSASTVASGDF